MSRVHAQWGRKGDPITQAMIRPVNCAITVCQWPWFEEKTPPGIVASQGVGDRMPMHGGGGSAPLRCDQQSEGGSAHRSSQTLMKDVAQQDQSHKLIE